MRTLFCVLFCALSFVLLAGFVYAEPYMQKGFTLTSWWNDDYLQAVSDGSLEILKSNGIEYVSLVVTWYQDTVSSTNIYRHATKTPTDVALIHAINKAHALGMKVMLKPHVDVIDGSWRGDITFSTETEWNNWFSSYADFIGYYANIAGQYGVEQFSVGTELKKTTFKTGNWKNIIADIRSAYSGPLTYAANWDDYSNINWWDSLDYAGIDAYFPLTAKNNPTLQELEDGWLAPKNALSVFYSTWKKPIIFTEIGYQSIDGTNMHPWWSSGSDDEQEQADSYRAAFESLFNETWFYGMYWWDWYYDYNNDHDKFGIYGKSAEDVVSEFYKTNYSVNKTVSGSGVEYRFYYNNHHFLSVVYDNGTFNIRPHPGIDENGWGSSLYMQPFFPNSVLKHSIIDKIAVYADGIEIIAHGNVSRNSGSYGTWNAGIKFSYNQQAKRIDGYGNYSITLDGALSSSTGDLNLLKIASNYLDDVPLLTGIVGDTGDMNYVNITGTGFNFIWNPAEQSAFYPQDKTNALSVEVVGQLNNVDTVAQGYAAIKPAYKPSLVVVLNSKQTGILMIFGGSYDTSKSKQFWEDNVGITPLVLKESTFVNYAFDFLFNSAALPNDGIDADFDGYNYSTDCNDNNTLINPGAAEVCDGKDNNCNNVADEGCPTILGDINNDSVVDIFDVQLVINQALALSPVTKEADVNNDSDVDIFDVQKIINIALGLQKGKICVRGRCTSCTAASCNRQQLFSILTGSSSGEICLGSCIKCTKGTCKATQAATTATTTTSTTTTTIACRRSSNCGSSGWIGSPVCQRGNVYQNYITYTCKNPGKTFASCSKTITRKLKQDCTYSQICTSGQCKAKTSRITPQRTSRR